MDPEGVAAAGRVPHGGTSETELLEFSANVNPHVPEGVGDVYSDALEASRRYPDDGYPVFREAAAGVVDCGPEQIVPTAGGLEAIRLAIATRIEPGDSVVIPSPSFSEYAREVRLQGGNPKFVPEDRVLEVDPEGVEMVVVCNPNNPTGRAYDHERLQALTRRCRQAGTALLVDEAFLSFTDRPSMAGTDGAVVARSLTKLYGLPGLRAGYAVATGERLEALQTARRAWSLSTPAATVGTHCLAREEFVDETRERVERERRRMRDELSERFDVSPSEAPFLLLDVGQRSVPALVEGCRDNGIAIRDARTFRRLDSHVRVAVRTPSENERLLEVLSDV